MNGMRVAPRSRASIANVAQHVRAVLAPGVPADQGLDMLRIFERLHEFKVTRRAGHALWLDYDVKPMPREIEGLATHSRRDDKIVVLISERMYGSLERREPRANFLAAHEIGHAVLHPDAICAGTPLHGLQRRVGPLKPFEDSEWQANALGAELLMPEAGVRMALIRGEVSPEAIARRFQVSVQAARYRLDQVR